MTNSEKIRMTQAFRDREWHSKEAKQKRQDRTEQKAIYDAIHSTRMNFKFNNKTDADILAWLNRQQSKQGAIKQLIRTTIAEEQQVTGNMAEWKECGDGIYFCSRCGTPSGWSHPAIKSQILDDYCSSCGAKMGNPAKDNKTPRETIQAHWIRETPHRYLCSVCGGKESAPRTWCPRCGTHTNKDATKERNTTRGKWKDRKNV